MSQENMIPVGKEYSAKDVAECLIWIADKGSELGENPDNNHVMLKEGITNLKLQKLLYFAQAAHLALFDKPLFREDFQAWSLGPVIPVLYQNYKKNNSDSNPIPPPQNLSCSDEDLLKFLNDIWRVFGKYSTWELVNLSHRDGSPWANHYKKGNNIVIPRDEIKSYYRKFFQIHEPAAEKC